MTSEKLGILRFEVSFLGAGGLPAGSLKGCTWTPKVCKIMAFRAVIMGLGLLFYILWGFR